MFKRLLALLAIAGLALGATACGSDSDSDSGASGDTTSQSGSGGDNTASTGVEGVDWQLMNIVGQGFVTSLPKDVQTPTLKFEGGNVKVFAGCNSGMGTADVGTDSIDFGPIAMTKKSCGSVADQVEFLVNKVLQGTVPYKLQGGSLNLTKGQDGLVYNKG